VALVLAQGVDAPPHGLDVVEAVAVAQEPRAPRVLGAPERLRVCPDRARPRPAAVHQKLVPGDAPEPGCPAAQVIGGGLRLGPERRQEGLLDQVLRLGGVGTQIAEVPEHLRLVGPDKEFELASLHAYRLRPGSHK